ncbi:MAG: glycosyltransferase family 39 protein, partial [Bacteroidetes bacterium]|nr:glycosyltransferase family 39 protein [Bacteroidota bacterium]
MGQDINWDLRNYHFYNPYAFLHHRLGFDIAPAMMQSYFNPFLDILNYCLITTQKPIVVGFILGAISGITAFFTYKITFLMTEKHGLALFSVLIGMTGYAGIVQLGSTTNETKTACLLLIGIYCILKSLCHAEKPFYWLFLGGFLSGLAIGFKLTAATMGIGIIVGFVFIQRPSKQH